MNAIAVPTGKAVRVIAIFGFIAWLAVSNWGYRKDLRLLQTRLEEQTRTVDQQSVVIATQAFQFQRANEISYAANRYGINADSTSREKEIEYRTILKDLPTCNLRVPDSIARGLFDYTNSLRSSAMPANPAITDTASARTSAAGELTYCQAVLWIDPLLAAIDKANNQLLAIRQLDEERKK
ncbi:hypothetical protein K7Y63_004120 [Serratia marcescens]|uniref:hypothetical protein n=1 Tax=Serratia sp. CC22-02 TaxID=1378076 RepID=UPI0024B86DD0|nr:hypothetical protein [Serratia sp. CC22-02]